MSDSYFRGMRGIEEITEKMKKMKKLVEFYQRNRPDITTLTLSRTDFDLIHRWPKAAKVCGFDITHNGMFYKGFELKYAKGEPRYAQKDEARA